MKQLAGKKWFNGILAMAPRGIRGRLYLLITAVLLPVVLLIGLTNYQRYETRRTMAIDSELEMAAAVGRTFEVYIDGVRRKLEMVGQSIVTFSPYVQQKAARMLELSVSEYTALRNISWVAPDGTVLASSEPQFVGRSLAQRGYFLQVVAGQPWALSELFPAGTITPSPTIGLAVGISDETGMLAGVVVAGIEPNLLGDLAHPHAGASGSLTIFDRKGVLVYRSPEAKHTWEQRLAWRENDAQLQEAMRSGGPASGVTRMRDSDERWLMARVPIRTTGYIAGTGRPMSVVMAGIYSDLLRELLLAGAVLALALAAAYVVSITIARPIIHLQEDARASGGGKMQRRRDLAAPAEVVVLRGAIENLVASLVQRADMLRRYELLSTNSRDILLFVRRDDGRISEANMAAELAYGYSREELLSMSVFDLRECRGTDDELAEQLAQADEAGILFETVHCRRDGSSFPVEVSSRGATINDERMLVSVIRDITDRKEAEKQLHDSREFIQHVLDSSLNGLYIYDVHQQLITFTNAEYARLTGYSLADLENMAGDHFVDVFHPDDRAKVISHIDAIASGRQSIPEIEYRFRRADGQWIWCLSRERPFAYAPDGTVSQYLGTFIDITARKQAEQELRESEAQLRTLADALPQLVWTADAAGRVDYYNQRRLEYEGISESIAGHYDWAPVLHEEDVEKTVSAWQNAVATGQTYEVEHRVRKADGAYRWHLSRALPIRDHDGRIVRWFGTATDVHATKQAEQALLQYSEQLERQVRERTAQLKGRTDQLRLLAGELTLAEQRERRRLARVLHDHLQQLLVGAKFRTAVLGRVEDESVRSAAHDIDRLLAEAIASSRSLTAELSPPILHEAGLIAGLEWLARWMSDKHALRVDLKISGQAPAAADDIKVLLFESVRELLFNVVKHSGTASATVRVDTIMTQPVQEPSRFTELLPHLRIVVSDTGVGFDPEKIRSGSTAGGGFGLFSIRERLELIGGRMDIDSRPGQGARFKLVAPLLPEPQAEQQLAARPVATAGGLEPAGKRRRRLRAKTPSGRIRLLLADDHQVMRQGLVQLLSQEGDIDVIGEAADGQEAVELARDLMPDVVLMDMSMPRLNGVEATRQIHTESPHVRVIGLSMFEEADRAQAMLDAGATAYRTKTCPAAELVATIRSAVASADKSRDGRAG